MKKDAFYMQYALKQNLYYFLGTRVHLGFLCFCYLFTPSFESFVYIYPFATLLLYRFVFSTTKNDNAYKSIFLLKLYLKVLKQTKERA